MYFHTDESSTIYWLANVALTASKQEQRLRIHVDDDGNLSIKRGEGIWSPPTPSTPDPYREPAPVKGMKWFLNEDGEPYRFPAEYQREAYPNDFHIPHDTEHDAIAYRDAMDEVIYSVFE